MTDAEVALSTVRSLPVAAPPLVAIRNLVSRAWRQLILNGASADIARGKITGLIGLNGSGKTTLLRAVVGEYPYRGEIVFRLRARPLAAEPRTRGLRSAATYTRCAASAHGPGPVRAGVIVTSAIPGHPAVGVGTGSRVARSGRDGGDYRQPGRWAVRRAVAASALGTCAGTVPGAALARRTGSRDRLQGPEEVLRPDFAIQPREGTDGGPGLARLDHGSRLRGPCPVPERRVDQVPGSARRDPHADEPVADVRRRDAHAAAPQALRWTLSERPTPAAANPCPGLPSRSSPAVRG